MVDLSTEYVGLKLKNPFLAAAAGITGSMSMLQKAEESGIAAVVLKSYFQKSICRISPAPHFALLKSGHGKIRAASLYSYEQASERDLAGYARLVADAKAKLSIPVIASVNCFTEQGWREAAQAVEAAGADAVELNLSCPHGVHLMSGMDLVTELAKATAFVRSLVSIPIVPKLTPQVSSPLALAVAVEKQGASGMVCFNRFTGLEIDLESFRPIMHGGYAGHGGPWSIYYNLRWLSQIAPAVKIPISASGGVWTGADAAKYLLAGATTVQLCSVIVAEGYGAVCRISRELEAYLERKGFANLTQFRGKLGKIKTMEEVDRTQEIVAAVEPEKCTGCGLCRRVCIYDAVRLDSGKARIFSCHGCGLCREVCPANAISFASLGERS
jgi:dihydroorotate dehydrogenase (fumarate)